MDLSEFLAARLGEDEAEANDFHDARRCGSLDRDGGFDLRQCGCGHPARVLREVEAGRKILTEYETNPGTEDYPYTAGLEYAVAALAAVYSDHPDYDEAWKP